MKKFLNWQLAAILITTLLLGLVSLPAKYQPSFFPDKVKELSVNLGLDLQGGSQLDYKIDLRDVAEKDKAQIIDGVLEVINKRVNKLGVSEPNIYTSKIGDETHIIVELAGIKDLDEAKNTVGKTIQLEFKEQATELDKTTKDEIRTSAETLLTKAKADPSSFAMLGDEESKANPGRVTYEESELQFRDELTGTKIASAVFDDKKVTAGTVLGNLIEDSQGLYLTADNQVASKDGLFLVKVLEKKENVEREIKTPKEVSSSHILIAYKGAQDADASITRSKKEAKQRAEEILAKAKAESADFAALAKEFSDEPGAKTSAGKLTKPVTENGVYAQEFTDAALKLENNGEIYALAVETDFGYHIIKADTVTPEKVEKRNETQVKLATIFFSTTPDQWKTTELTGQYFVRADVTFDQTLNPQVSIQFNSEGAKLFEEITDRNVNKPVAIFVGGEQISAPVVQEKISGGQAVINGRFTADEAKLLARDLNTGAIPAPITLTGQYTIGASLGHEALQQSMIAGLIGILLLTIYMIAYYRVPGVIASIALGSYSFILLFLIQANFKTSIALVIALLIFGAVVMKIINNEKEPFWEKTISMLVACFALFFFTFLLSNPVVLTLAGVAGVILSIGMAVDANVLIFERIKEEIRAGRTYLSAVEVGFDRAWSSIRDSNFSSLITCAILYYFGSSIIRGFALNLAAGILISMFSAVTITRVFMLVIRNTKIAENNKLMGFSEKKERTPFKIIENSKYWLSGSGILITISIIALLAVGIKTGIDFKGGSLMDVKFPTEATVTTEAITEALTEVENKLDKPEGTESVLGTPNIISSGESSYIVRMNFIDNDTHELILSKFREKFSTNLEESRFTTIGPSISASLKNKAIISLLVAMAAIILYIAFAFRHIPKHLSSWKFGACAIIALVHDVLITVGVFSVFQLEVDALFITALLTVIGFSVHDTIVVFDRIRENLKSFDPKTQTFAEVCNASLTQTMARSLNTSISTLITLLALFLLGSASIKTFILALIIGITVGTYSSVFVASPILTRIINRAK